MHPASWARIPQALHYIEAKETAFLVMEHIELYPYSRTLSERTVRFSIDSRRLLLPKTHRPKWGRYTLVRASSRSFFEYRCLGALNERNTSPLIFHPTIHPTSYFGLGRMLLPANHDYGPQRNGSHIRPIAPMLFGNGSRKAFIWPCRRSPLLARLSR